jgi:hypothetical protein
MSRIFDNTDQDLLTARRATMQVSNHADFCVGYLNLRAWEAMDDLIEDWGPERGQVCRVLVGIQRPPHDEIRELYRQVDTGSLIDNATATVPPAAKPVKQAARNACRDVKRGLIQ